MIFLKNFIKNAFLNKLTAESLIVMHFVKTFALFGYVIFFSFLSRFVSSQRLYKDIFCPFISFDMVRDQTKSTIKNKKRQPSVLIKMSVRDSYFEC